MGTIFLVYVQSANVPLYRTTTYRPLAFSSYCSCALEWWDVCTPQAFLEHFRFSRHIYIHYILNFNEPLLLVSFASLAELNDYYFIESYLYITFIMPQSKFAPAYNNVKHHNLPSTLLRQAKLDCIHRGVHNRADLAYEISK